MPPTNGHSRPRSFADVFPERTPAPSSHLRALIANAIFTRTTLAQTLTDPRRNLNRECGYPDTITPQMYQDAYERNSTAKRVVEFLAQEAWQVTPDVYEDENVETLTPFEARWREVGRSLYGRHNWHKGDEGSALWSHLKEVNAKSRIGAYGVLLLGFDDGLPLDQPVAGVVEENSGVPATANGTLSRYRLTTNAAGTKGRELIYLRALPEAQAPITRYETNESSPRYSHPVEYSVTFQDPSLAVSGFAAPQTVRNVHWTRVVHVAEGVVFHAPPMRAVFDHLLDLKKTYGADPEAFWKNALAKLILEVPPEWAANADIDYAGTKDKLEQFWNGLDPGLLLEGLTAKSLAPVVADPTSHIDAQIQGVCVEGGYPKRVFTGSEVGTLASSQDRKTWKERVKEYRRNHVGPRIVCEFVNRLILVGVLPEPAQFYLSWPDIEVLTEQERAQAALTKSQAIAAYEAGGRTTYGRMDFLVRVMGETEEDARTIIANADAEKEAEQKKAQAEQAKAAQVAAEAQAGAVPQPDQQPAATNPPSPDATAGGGGQGPPARTPPQAPQAAQPPITHALAASPLDADALQDAINAGLLPDPVLNYSDEQPRDYHGRWTSGGFAGVVGAIKSALGFGPKEAGPTAGQHDFPHGWQSSQAARDYVDGKSTHDLHHGLASGREDTMLRDIMNESGRGGLPKPASSAEIDALGKQGWYVGYRGLGQQQYAEQFKSGPLYPGAGTRGNGLYFTYTGRARSEASARTAAEMYAGANAQGGQGAVIRIAFPPGARIVDEAKVTAERNAYLKDINDQRFSGKMSVAEHEKLAALHMDLGRFAALKNYDAIRVKDNGFLVVLNRSKVVVER